jgi:NADH:ubiquinone oxidoreductase subunit 6 (subunit J)
MWAPAPFAGFGLIGAIGALFAAVALVLVVVLKGYALWHAAKRDEKAWFIVLLIVNTAGILDLVYLIFIVKKWHKAAKSGTMSANENSNGPAAN